MVDEPERSGTVAAEAIYGAQTHRPLVRITLRAGDRMLSLLASPSEALQISDQIRGATYAALGDAAVIAMLESTSPIDNAGAGSVLEALRRARSTIDRREGMGDR